MTFMQKVIEDSMQIWRDSADERFLNEMRDGTLKKEKFLDYIVQDSLYLRDYLKAYAMAIFKSKNLKQMQVFYSALGFVNDSENATRLSYLKDYGMTDDDVENVKRYKENTDYCNFLIDTAKNCDIPEIIMAVMPCLLGYNYVFERVRERDPKVMQSYYAPMVEDYTSCVYKQCCKYWTDFANEQCENLDEDRKQRLNDIFKQASLHELYFWQMAGEDRL